jgi:hypothetical protein
MATKHINDELWHRIEDLTVRANARQKPDPPGQRSGRASSGPAAAWSC